VLARSSPEDKLTLVSLLKHHGEVVAVTGERKAKTHYLKMRCSICATVCRTSSRTVIT
jgi:hypothetical protein